ncbi:Hypothetical predicted protein [Mytilus galloprovincialis]|uniref:Uncharacterized protein n=1 Tax=Mytilus galloprovincialis TaxID=29158 RepID=A0A8B6HH64_MYTGA|nr:Hypothetical predicted protein [Mytilus galloprovincialis]
MTQTGVCMLGDRVRCVYVRCQNRSSQDTFKNCRQQLDGFACNISSTSYNVTTVIPRPTSVFASAIISSSDSSSSYIEYVSSNKPQQHTAKSTVLIKGKVSMYAQSNKEHASLHTRVISGSSLYHTSKHPASAASLKTSLISTKTNTIDMSTVVYSSFVTNNHKIELIENNSMHGTTTRNLNRSKVHQSRIGVFVGVSVTILVAMIVGLFITCRLRHLGPFKEKAEDYTNPITKTANPNYHDIDFDLEKETNFIDNASKNNVLEIKCDDIKFKATDDTTNGKTNSHNNTYAVVEKNRIPDAIKKEENQDKDENRSSNVESDYYSLNQPRRISGDESSNIYDTSNGNMDDIDPTYNTTTDVHAIERTNASDYDHL